MDTRGPEQVGEALDQRIDSLFRQRPYDAGEGGEGVSASVIFRALRHFAGDHRRAQRPLHAIVCWLDPWVGQKAEQAPTVMVPAELIEQPLVVWIFQVTVAQLVGHLGLQGFRFGLEVGHRAITIVAPQRQCLLQLGFELFPEVACPNLSLYPARH